jgi:tetratricopeptide (TPR) repeat protein
MRSASHALILLLCVSAQAKKPIEVADDAMQLDSVEGANQSLTALQPFEDFPALWRKARACAWLAEEFTDTKSRDQMAAKGIEYARRAIALEPDRVEGHYYLAENTRLQASAKGIAAYPMIPRARDQAALAAKADEKFDHAGPLRLLGRIYAEAPGWPASLGDPTAAVQYLQRALQLDPSYPENHLRMAKALKAQGKSFAQESRKLRAAPSKPEYAHRLMRWKSEAP